MKHPINRPFRDVVNIALRKNIALESHVDRAIQRTAGGRDHPAFTRGTPR
jgi:hypothetical protein